MSAYDIKSYLFPSIERMVERIAKAIESKGSDTHTHNTYNVYVTTSGADTARDIADAVKSVTEK